MCGITAIFAYRNTAAEVDPRELIAIRDQMAARGPDGKGEWMTRDRRVGLGHRRLAIIDPDERAAQPMLSEDGKRSIVFNGEIYNFKSIRSGLEQRGHRFHTESDTEVLLQLYAEKGEGMLHDLRGMFALVIWDAERNKLFMARDPYGIKPLYFSDDGSTLRVASQVKALLAGGQVSENPDPAGIVGFHLFGSIPEPFTLYRAIKQLPAGHFLWADETGIGAPQKWFSIAETYQSAETRQSELRDVKSAVCDALHDSVRHHLVADVPVGAFLSAGIDSGSLVGVMRDCGASDIQTVTLAFDEFAGTSSDEAPLAEEVARHYETRHVTRRVGRAEFEQDLPAILDAMDQPSIDGINTWFVSKAAAELGLKVAVSGLGGDELFGGYPSFSDIPRWVKSFRIPGKIPHLGRGTRALAAPLTGPLGLNPKAAGILELGGCWEGAYLLRRGLYMPWELDGLLGKQLAREGLERLKPLEYISHTIEPRPASPFARVACLESSLYMRNQLLRDSDWTGMAHSLEIRVPLVDSELLSSTAALALADPSWSKRRLAAAPGKPLPTTITEKAKTGFTTPVAEWQTRHVAGNAKSGLRPWSRTVFNHLGSALGLPSSREAGVHG